MKRITIFWIFMLLVGCQTSRGTILFETQSTISESRRAIVGVIGDPLSISENGHELRSKYYDRKEKLIYPDAEPKERFYTFVTILGDRRPYDISVEVIREIRRSNGLYTKDGYDEILAQRIAMKIKQMLNQSRENRNVIDDFKPY